MESMENRSSYVVIAIVIAGTHVLVESIMCVFICVLPILIKSTHEERVGASPQSSALFFNFDATNIQMPCNEVAIGTQDLENPMPFLKWLAL